MTTITGTTRVDRATPCRIQYEHTTSAMTGSEIKRNDCIGCLHPTPPLRYEVATGTLFTTAAHNCQSHHSFFLRCLLQRHMRCNLFFNVNFNVFHQQHQTLAHTAQCAPMGRWCEQSVHISYTLNYHLLVALNIPCSQLIYTDAATKCNISSLTRLPCGSFAMIQSCSICTMLLKQC